MPYEIRPAGDGYKVFKKGTDESMTDKPMTRDRAQALLESLYANEPAARKEAADYSQSVMVALKVPEHIGAELVLPLKRMQFPTEPVSDLHVTLCYLGEISEQPMRVDAVVQLIENSLWQFAELKGKINGFGRFSGDGDKDVIYANYDAPMLPDLRHDLYTALKGGNFPVRNNHGYTPHITLSYIPKEAETPHIRLPEFEFTLKEVILFWGTMQVPIALKGNRIKAQAAGDDMKGGLTVFKEKDTDRYRWVMLSSNAYRDRDGQIVSEKALRADVDRAAVDGDYGPLRWWHVPGLDIGTCDFNMMHGKVLVESGTFHNAETAKAMMAAADSLSGSIAFRHPLTEPDGEGVFHTIRIRERSLLPKGKESNPFVSLVKISGEDPMTTIKEKVQKFMNLIGDKDGQKTQAILAAAEDTEQMAKELGAAFKEAGFENITEDTAQVLAEMIAADTQKAAKKPPVKVEVEVEDEDAEEMEDEESDEESGEEMVEKLMTGKKKEAGDEADLFDGREFIGDMSPDQFSAFMSESLQATVGARLDAIESRLSSTEKAADERVADLEAENTALKEKLAQLEGLAAKQGDTLKELGADLPPALRGFIMGLGASQDGSTVISKEKAAAMGPTADPDANPNPVESFADNFLFEGTPFSNKNGQS